MGYRASLILWVQKSLGLLMRLQILRRGLI